MVMREGYVKPVNSSLCALVVWSLFFLPTLAWGSLRVGNAEIQVYYSQNHQFLYDDATYGIDWVQFRNELGVKFTYTKLIDQGLLFDQIAIPHVAQANFYAYYRGRFDPIYEIRDRYRKLADTQTRGNMEFPENQFREFFLDTNFGEVGPGELSMRLGRQQIVWGEADLFRSLDIINPLRVDQNSLVGERFDDYRTPLWILKFIYSMGLVGPFSDVGIEPFYSPNWQPLLSDALVGEGVRLYNNSLPQYVGQRGLGASFVRRDLTPWKSFEPHHLPWQAARQGTNMHHDAPAYVCLFTQNCEGAAGAKGLGERVEGYFNWDYNELKHTTPHGWDVSKSMAGVRIMAKTGDRKS